MKLFLTSIALIASASSFASTSDSHSLPILGTESNDSFSLLTTQTKTLYRQETVSRICYRQEVVGHHQVCEGGTRDIVAIDKETRGAGDNHGQQGEQKPGGQQPGGERPGQPGGDKPTPRPPVCRDEPIFRDVPYTCYETISVPYEVVDHYTKSNFDVRTQAAPNDLAASAGCAVTFQAYGDAVSASTGCASMLVLANSNSVSDIDQGGTHINSYKYDLKVVDANRALAPLAGGLSDLKLEGQTLIVKTGDLKKGSNFQLRLFVERRNLLKKDETKIDRALTASEYTYEALDASSGLVKIDLNKLLGGINRTKKHSIRVNLDVQVDGGSIINTNVPNLHQESKITIWDSPSNN
jgi:hypothetical protein